MDQTTIRQYETQGHDSLVRVPRTSRHFLVISDSAPHTETTMICEQCGKVFTIFLECGDRTCLDCQKRRRKRILKRYLPIVNGMHEAKFITLTLTRRKLFRGTKERPGPVNYIRKCFTKLRHRDFWIAMGGMYQIEIGTIMDGTANIHLHIIADTHHMPKSELRKAWHNITGDSYVVDIKKCWGRHGALYYLTKHMGKRIGTYEHAGLINDVLKGTRLVQGFGNLSRMGLSMKDSFCPNCGGKNTLYLDLEISNYQYPPKTTGF